MTSSRGTFDHRFGVWARRIRAHLVARRMLAGLTVGLVGAAGLAAVAWWLRAGHLRPWAALLGLAGALAGVAVALRRRWSDMDVALYLDARLGAHEAIATAVELRRQPEREDSAHEIVVVDAENALAGASSRSVRPRVLHHWYALAPLGALGVVWLSMISLPPPPPAPPPPPGAELVRMKKLAGLERIEALAHAPGRDASDKKRLDEIAERAKKLREQLRRGIEKRQAQAEVAKLRDDIALLSRSFGDQKNRPGLEAAIRQLQKNQALQNAARALGDGDLTAFDREMQALANRIEAEHREQAKHALEEAIKAARERGAEDVARALEEQRRLWDERSARGQALRELANALKGKLSEEALEDLREFGQTGSPEAQRRLSEALADALEKLTDEERKKLAANLRNEQGEGSASPMTKQQLEDLAKKLATAEGKKDLERMLRDLARREPGNEAERQRSLDDAERGGAEAQRGLGVLPLPMGGDDSAAARGSKKDPGHGNHEGKTGDAAGSELRAKAKTQLDPRGAWHGTTLGRAPARPGETANQVGRGALGAVGPAEVGGVERSDVPEEYREQVGRYFSP